VLTITVIELNLSKICWKIGYVYRLVNIIIGYQNISKICSTNGKYLLIVIPCTIGSKTIGNTIGYYQYMIPQEHIDLETAAQIILNDSKDELPCVTQLTFVNKNAFFTIEIRET